MCEDGRRSDASCGPATVHRTRFNNDLCARRASVVAGNITLRQALRGAVLDIVLMPKEDETLWLRNSRGEYYFSGIVGDALTYAATAGGFEWNAIVVEPPSSADVYAGSWDAWLSDWINRGDLVAVWFYDTTIRREIGASFPHSFYNLSPVLLVEERDTTEPFNAYRFFFSYLMPFSWQLWCSILTLFVLVGFLDGLTDDKMPRWSESSFLSKLAAKWYVGFYGGIMSFVASGGLGYNGEIGSNNFSGGLLRAG